MLAAGIKHTALVIGSSNLVCFGLTTVFETHKLTDLVGVGSFVLATASLSHKYEIFIKPTNIRIALINSLVIMWGARLSTHLFSRVLNTHEDKRLRPLFKEKDEGWFDSLKSNYPIKLLGFWSIQALWGIICMVYYLFIITIHYNYLL